MDTKYKITDDLGMFTHAGNAAVQQIVQRIVEKFADETEAYNAVMFQLEQLRNVSCFAEATDTEVRERVYRQVRDYFKYNTRRWVFAEISSGNNTELTMLGPDNISVTLECYEQNNHHFIRISEALWANRLRVTVEIID